MSDEDFARAALEARIEALELGLLAVLAALPAESRASIREKMGEFVGADLSRATPPTSLVPPQSVDVFRDVLSERMQAMLKKLN